MKDEDESLNLFSISCRSIFLDISFPESEDFKFIPLDLTQLECIGYSSLRYRAIELLGSRACLPPDPMIMGGRNRSAQYKVK